MLYFCLTCKSRPLFSPNPARSLSLSVFHLLSSIRSLQRENGEVNIVTIEIGVEVQTASLLTDVSKLSTSWQVISMGKGRSTGSSRS